MILVWRCRTSSELLCCVACSGTHWQRSKLLQMWGCWYGSAVGLETIVHWSGDFPIVHPSHVGTHLYSRLWSWPEWGFPYQRSRWKHAFKVLATKRCVLAAKIFPIQIWTLASLWHQLFSPHCCKCYNFVCTAAIRCGSACQGPHKREAGFPNPQQALSDSSQLRHIMTRHTAKNTALQ